MKQQDWNEYSINGNGHADPVFNSNEESLSQTIEGANEDWEWTDDKFASLVDFDDSPEIPLETIPESDLADSVLESNAIPQAELFDDPIEGKTQPKFSTSPFPKAAAVGLVMLVLFGGGGLFLQSVTSSASRKAPAIANSPSPQPTPTVPPTPDTEVGNLKTQVALGAQAAQIQDLDRTKSPKTPKTSVSKINKDANRSASTQESSTEPRSSTPPPSYPPRPIVQRSSTPPPSYSPRPVVQREYTPPPSRPAQSAQLARPSQPTQPTQSAQPARKAVEASSPSALPSQPKPTPDPMQQWVALSQIGSYGTNPAGEDTSQPADSRTKSIPTQTEEPFVTTPRAIPVMSSTAGAVVTPTNVPLPVAAASKMQIPRDGSLDDKETVFGSSELPQGVSLQPIGGDDTRMWGHEDAEMSGLRSPVLTTNSPHQPPLPNATGNQIASPPTAQINPTEEASLLSGVPVRYLQVGELASGELLTPVIWAGARASAGSASNSAASSAQEKFIVELHEPLTDPQGSVMLPQGTQIVAQIINVGESGLTQLEATQAIVDGQEYVLPPGAISIRGSDGQPLMADKWGKKGNVIASRDVTAFLFGSLSKVGEVLNQPDVQQSINSSSGGFSSSTTTSNRRPNLLGAILDGGFGPLTQQILQRNDKAIQEIMSRPDVWYVRAGTNIQVFVNRSFEM